MPPPTAWLHPNSLRDKTLYRVCQSDAKCCQLLVLVNILRKTVGKPVLDTASWHNYGLALYCTLETFVLSSVLFVSLPKPCSLNVAKALSTVASRSQGPHCATLAYGLVRTNKTMKVHDLRCNSLPLQLACVCIVLKFRFVFILVAIHTPLISFNFRRHSWLVGLPHECS